MYPNAQSLDFYEKPAAWFLENEVWKIKSPDFYLVSVNGLTYLVAAHRRNDAVGLLAEEMGIATEPSDWTLLADEMFGEIRTTGWVAGGRLSRNQYLGLCRNSPGFVDRVDVVSNVDDKVSSSPSGSERKVWEIA